MVDWIGIGLVLFTGLVSYSIGRWEGFDKGYVVAKTSERRKNDRSDK